MIITTVQNKKNNTQNFKGPLDGAITQSLITIDTNPMVNAALVDIFAMVIPRTYVDTKERNKYAGAETLFRELTGTIIVCLSSGILAKGIAHLYNKIVEPKININPNSWVTNDGINLLKHAWDKGLSSEKYVDNVLSNISGFDGKETSEFKNIDWNKVEWLDDSKWSKWTWSNPKFRNIQHELKNKEQINRSFAETIDDKTLTPHDANQILEIIEHRIANALKVNNSVSVKIDDKTLSSSLKNLLRDTYDLGKNVFAKKGISIDNALSKIQKMNKTKTLGALAIASGLGLTNQYINRIITKKRTGTDAFVGEVDYKNIVNKKERAEKRENKTRFLGLKFLASAGIIALAAGVMRIKNPKDFIKKLEFTGPITSGNAIKTVYTATLVGRFLAAKNETELRESVTRDYLGFLNWLVLGGFAAKGVANLLDRNRTSLFNVAKDGTGFRHWLNNISLKSHAEIASKGSDFAKKNIWKLNLAHGAGLLYSTLALGFLIPLLNIAVTKHKHKHSQKYVRDENKFNLSQKPLPDVFKGLKN